MTTIITKASMLTNVAKFVAEWNADQTNASMLTALGCTWDAAKTKATVNKSIKEQLFVLRTGGARGSYEMPASELESCEELFSEETVSTKVVHIVYPVEGQDAIAKTFSIEDTERFVSEVRTWLQEMKLKTVVFTNKEGEQIAFDPSTIEEGSTLQVTANVQGASAIS